MRAESCWRGVAARAWGYRAAAHCVTHAFQKKGATWWPPNRDHKINSLFAWAFFLAPIVGRLSPQTEFADNFLLNSGAAYRSLHVVGLVGIVVLPGKGCSAHQPRRNGCEDLGVSWKGIGNETDYGSMPWRQTVLLRRRAKRNGDARRMLRLFVISLRYNRTSRV